MISFKILSENRDNNEFKGEVGLSILINVNKQEFLLDTGHSDLFLTNAKLLGVDLSKIQKVVLTHGHNDHTDGVVYLDKGKTIYVHPSAFKERYSIRHNDFAGFVNSLEELSKNHNVITTKQPIEFVKNCYFLGEIPMVVDFEKNGNFSTTLDKELKIQDYTEDDSGVAIKTPNGIFVLTGCGHRGICNVIEHAKKITCNNNVLGVLGGFHLKDLEAQKPLIDNIIEYFKQNKIKQIYLGHCIKDEIIDYIEVNLKDSKIIRLASGKVFDVKI